MIKRFFKKKTSSSTTAARKTVKAEKPKTKTMHQRTLTAEGWRRMMMRTRKGKKA
jgi:hypothetical protein